MQIFKGSRTDTKHTILGAILVGRLLQRDNDMAFFVPLLNIAVRLDDLIERIDPVNDRFELARLDQFFEQE